MQVRPTNAFRKFAKEEIEQSISLRFEQQAEKYPHRFAIKSRTGELTYRDLNRVANRIARAIVCQRGSEQEPVALLLGQRSTLIAAVLGTLKARKIYVPLDPSYPAPRLNSMVEDSGAVLILAESKNMELARTLARGQAAVVNVDDVPEEPGDQNLGLQISPDCLSYILYTSGTTGEPKGVFQNHRNVLHKVMNYTNTSRLSAEDRLSLLVSFSFSAAVPNVFAALLNGASLFPFDVKEDGLVNLAKWLAEEEITIYQSVTSVFRHFLATLSGGETFPKLRLIDLFGEPVSAVDVEGYKKHFSDQCLLRNRMASTELGDVRQYFISKDTPVVGGIVPVGYAIQDKEVLLLDDAGRGVGVNQVGEIVVKSPYLALGYWGQPELTRAIFRACPGEGDTRIYHTGDLGYMLTDGCLIHIGRKDFQLKVRGHRIEPTEIEAALLSHNGIEGAVVLARESGPRGKFLIAYVVSRASPAPSTRELRDFLGQRLPDYMIPAAFVFLGELPMTPSGKVDLQALPAPSGERRNVSAPFAGPRNPLEEALTAIWSEALGVEPVGIQDNFLELGGDSLLAAQILSRLLSAFEVDVPMRLFLESPTVAGLADAIKEQQRKPKETWERAEGLPVIKPAPDERHVPFPLTDVQQAYWVGRSEAFELGGVAAHGYLEIEVVDLDVDRLELALRRLIERHDMLRAIVLPDGQQQILERVPHYSVELTDLRGWSREREAQLESVRRLMSHQMLEADRWPLFDIRASRLDDRRFRLHISFDLLISDAWSWRILRRELYQLYINPNASLPAFALSYRDYVMAERDLLRSELYQKSRNYWLERLPTLRPAPELPLAKNPASVRSPTFVRRSGRLESETWQKLKGLGVGKGLTPSAVLLAAFAELLKVWCKNPQFTINVTLFNRFPLHPEVNDLVGDFTSLTLLEVNNSEASTFEERARRLQTQLWEDLDRRLFNGIRVLRELTKRERGMPRAFMPVVFTSALNYGSMNGADPIADLGETVYHITQTPQVWLDHQVREERGALIFNWDAVEELFPEGLLDHMFEGYNWLLRKLGDDEESWRKGWTEMARELIPPAQLCQRASVNATDASVPEKRLHELFIEQVSRRPDQPAVVARDKSLSYHELYRCASRVACWAREQGARPDALVAVVMEKGLEQIVAVLGSLMSGAAYLPVDPALPEERFRYLLEQGEVNLALTQSWIDGKLPWPDHVRRLCLDNGTLWGFEEESPQPLANPGSLAYVIYTSGSTGLPKGVMIDHRGAVNTILDVNRRLGACAGDRILAISSLSFDLSVYDIFGTLAAGGTIVVPDASCLRDPDHWLNVITQERVTLWNSVPALMRMLVEYAGVRRRRLPDSLRCVLLSGDWIPLTLPEQIKSLGKQIEVISLGGATEASIWSIMHRIERIDPDWKSIPYGKPMANQRFHVLNETLDPCPVWVPGQLYIGGMGLAGGYWRDEVKSRESFIIHPRTGERLYRTGDLGRYLPDGNIEFLGREDLQVKIQGYRVELGEIEVALANYPSIRAAVAAAPGDIQGEKRLAAYVVPEPGASLSAAEVQEFLRQKLPEYMVPSTFKFLDQLPLTANGKVDRAALFAAPKQSGEIEPASQNGEDGVRQVIAAGIAAILKVERVDPDANLLQLGATSLDIIRIANLLEEKLGFRPKLDEFYRLPTVDALAKTYEQKRLQGQLTSPHLDRQLPGAPAWQKLELLRGPQDRLAFKKGQPGLRRGDGERTSILAGILAGAAPPKQDTLRRYLERRTHREFDPAPLPLCRLGDFLSCLRQVIVEGEPKNLYASAGGLYPVQTYLYVKPERIDGLATGTYYYHPADHRLVLLSAGATVDRNVYGPLVNGPVFDSAAFAIFLIAQMSAIAPMYGERSLHFVTIEAGLMAQLLETCAADHGIGLCQIGGLDFESIRNLFLLSETHIMVHSLLGGSIDPQREKKWSGSAEACFRPSDPRDDREEGEL